MRYGREGAGMFRRWLSRLFGDGLWLFRVVAVRLRVVAVVSDIRTWSIDRPYPSDDKIVHAD